MDLEKIFGGSPLGVIVRLVIISVIVGVIMHALDLKPLGVAEVVKELIVRISNLGIDVFNTVFGFFILGAAVVVPVWIVYRVIKSFGKNEGPRS